MTGAQPWQMAEGEELGFSPRGSALPNTPRFTNFTPTQNAFPGYNPQPNLGGGAPPINPAVTPSITPNNNNWGYRLGQRYAQPGKIMGGLGKIGTGMAAVGIGNALTPNVPNTGTYEDPKMLGTNLSADTVSNTLGGLGPWAQGVGKLLTIAPIVSGLAKRAGYAMGGGVSAGDMAATDKRLADAWAKTHSVGKILAEAGEPLPGVMPENPALTTPPASGSAEDFLATRGIPEVKDSLGRVIPRSIPGQPVPTGGGYITDDRGIRHDLQSVGGSANTNVLNLPDDRAASDFNPNGTAKSKIPAITFSNPITDRSNPAYNMMQGATDNQNQIEALNTAIRPYALEEMSSKSAMQRGAAANSASEAKNRGALTEANKEHLLGQAQYFREHGNYFANQPSKLETRELQNEQMKHDQAMKAALAATKDDSTKNFDQEYYKAYIAQKNAEAGMKPKQVQKTPAVKGFFGGVKTPATYETEWGNPQDVALQNGISPAELQEYYRMHPELQSK
jgi:hypothetical protein